MRFIFGCVWASSSHPAFTYLLRGLRLTSTEKERGVLLRKTFSFGGVNQERPLQMLRWPIHACLLMKENNGMISSCGFKQSPVGNHEDVSVREQKKGKLNAAFVARTTGLTHLIS